MNPSDFRTAAFTETAIAPRLKDLDDIETEKLFFGLARHLNDPTWALPPADSRRLMDVLLLSEAVQWLEVGTHIGFFSESVLSQIRECWPTSLAWLGWGTADPVGTGRSRFEFGQALAEAHATGAQIEFLRLVMLASNHEWQAELEVLMTPGWRGSLSSDHWLLDARIGGRAGTPSEWRLTFTEGARAKGRLEELCLLEAMDNIEQDAGDGVERIEPAASERKATDDSTVEAPRGQGRERKTRRPRRVADVTTGGGEASVSSVKAIALLDQFANLSVAEFAEFVAGFEEMFGAIPARYAAEAPLLTGHQSDRAGDAGYEVDIILESAGDKRIQVIKEVRALTSLGLKEAKDLVDAAPDSVLGKGVPRAKALKAKGALESAGAVVRLTDC